MKYRDLNIDFLSLIFLALNILFDNMFTMKE